MSSQVQDLYGFGPFQVDPRERVLLCDGRPLSLTPKAFDTLLVLVENHGHIVEKEELLKLVWPDTFVEEATLAKNVSTLRQVLGDDGERFIETVPKRGYRFVAPVERRGPPRSTPSAKPALGPRAMAAGFVLLILAGYLAFVLFSQTPVQTVEAPARPARVKVAVLPFTNLSASAGEEYFADGLTEEMIAQLSRLYPERLAVIARTTAMQYRGSKKSAGEIGRELGVDYILEGSLRREGQRVRITAQLIQTRDQTHVWAENYEREVREVLALQGEVARAIAGQIGIELRETRAGAATGTASAEAYEDYLRGRFFWNKLTVVGYQRAIQHFEAAIRKDSNYAEAYAGLADSYANLGLWGLPGREALAKAKAAADKAVELRETLADGHASRAFIAMGYEWDWERAEREFQRALVLNPSYAHAHHRYGYLLMLRGRWDEAGAEMKKAQELDPLSMIINANIGFRLYLMRQYDAALAHWDKNLEMDPEYPLLHGYKGIAYVMKKMYPEALAAFEKARGTPGVLSAQGYVHGVAGREQEARKLLAELTQRSKREFVPAFYVALLCTGLGDKDQAFAWLDKAYEERSGYLMEIHLDPMFDPLRGDPRYAALMKRLGHVAR